MVAFDRPALSERCALDVCGQALLRRHGIPAGARLLTLKPFRKKRPAFVPAALSDQSPRIGRSETKDPFRAAAHRLNNLLSGTGDGAEELVNSALEEEAAETKVLLACLSGSIVSAAAVVICWLLHKDPFGGASLSVDSALHAAVGAAVSLPAGAAKVFGWTDRAHRLFPVLQDIHEVEARRLQSLLTGLTSQQVAVVAVAEILSTVLVLLPAWQGGLQSGLNWYCHRLQEVGWEVPEGASEAGALLLMAVICGLGRVVDHAPSEEEYEIVGDAVSNADRYYRLVSTSVSQRQEDADQMAAAFKLTAAAWFAQRTTSGVTAAVMTFAEFSYLGALWLWTQDLATPLAAALTLYGSDFVGMHQRFKSVK